MATARKVSLFHREIRTHLSSAAIEILLGQAQVLSEGQLEDDSFFGSSMITIDLSQAIDWVSDPCDATTNSQLSNLLLKDERFKDRVRRLGVREATKLARTPLDTPQIEMHLRSSGDKIHVDIDVEAASRQAKAS